MSIRDSLVMPLKDNEVLLLDEEYGARHLRYEAGAYVAIGKTEDGGTEFGYRDVLWVSKVEIRKTEGWE